MLTKLAKRKLDAIIAEALEAQYKIESRPSTTTELFSSLIFLDEIQERVRYKIHSNSSFFSCYFYSIYSRHLLALLSSLLSPYPPPPLYPFPYTLLPDSSARGGAGDCMSDVQSD